MLPRLTPYRRTRETVTDIRGLNMTGACANGELAWTENIDTAAAPAARRRAKRYHVTKLEKPNGIAATDKLLLVDGETLYYGGKAVGTVEDSYKRMIGIGSSVAIFPDKVLFDTVTGTMRAMEQRNTVSGALITLAQADGTPYTGYTKSATAPENPQNGDMWLDISATPLVMKTWSESAQMWVEEYTTHVCVEAAGIGAGLRAEDAVDVTGLGLLDGTWVLSYAEADKIVFTGIIAEETQVEGEIVTARKCPDMPFVIEHNNRLWGCSADGHEIYACALGDPTNWYKYAGISTDSYAVTVGSPGIFTGAAVINSSVCFFKSDCITKIYGTMPSNYQMTVDNLRGIEQGSGDSIVRINELLYYKSPFDVCRYDSSAVYGASSAFGTWHLTQGVAGALDRRMYLSARDDGGSYHLMVYDTVTGYWLREDDSHALGFATLGSVLYMLDAEGNVWALPSDSYGEAEKAASMGDGPLAAVSGGEETDEAVPWLMRTGEILTTTPDNKRVGKIQLLLEMDRGCHTVVRLKKDNEDWAEVADIRCEGKRRYTLPIWPKRCDRFQVELSGTGPCMLHHMSWCVEAASEYGREGRR